MDDECRRQLWHFHEWKLAVLVFTMSHALKIKHVWLFLFRQSIHPSILQYWPILLPFPWPDSDSKHSPHPLSIHCLFTCTHYTMTVANGVGGFPLPFLCHKLNKFPNKVASQPASQLCFPHSIPTARISGWLLPLFVLLAGIPLRHD